MLSTEEPVQPTARPTMPSPIAHSLAGLTIAHALAPEPLRGRAVWLGFAVVAGNAPDLDFLAGLVSGSINALHGGPSHSIGAAAVFASVCALALGARRRLVTQLFVTAFVIYTSHVLLDMACEPSPKRPGLPLLWPLTSEGLLFPWRPLLGIAHGTHGSGVSGFVAELFSARNLGPVLLELAVFAPLLALVYTVRGVPACLRRGRPGPAAAPGIAGERC